MIVVSWLHLSVLLLFEDFNPANIVLLSSILISSNSSFNLGRFVII